MIRRRKRGVAFSVNIEVLKALFGIPDDVDLEVNTNFYRDCVMFKAKKITESEAGSEDIAILGTKTKLYEMCEGQEYTTFNLDANMLALLKEQISLYNKLAMGEFGE